MGTELYREPERDVPVLGEYDVVITGGGPAGCAAAVAAAGMGAKTLVVERSGALGGAPVTQGVAVVLSTNGVDFQGIWHQWAGLLQKRGGMAGMIRSPSHFYKDLMWFRSSFDPEMCKWAWDLLVEDAGAHVLLQAQATAAMMQENRVTGVIVETRGGPGAIRARVTVDASGDGIISHRAGAAWHRGVTGKLWPQQVSLTFTTGRYGDMPGVEAGRVRDGLGGSVGNKPQKRGRRDLKRVDPLDPWAVSAAIRTLQRQIWHDTADLPQDQYLVETALDLGVRTSRIVDGLSVVSDDDAWEYRKNAGGIARSSWELDVHPPDDEPIPRRFYHSESPDYGERNKRTTAGDYFDIPYGCLLPRGVKGLLVAGRIVSSGYLAQGSLRIQQTCMATGQAAGTAAALSVAAGIPPADLDVSDVRRALENARAVEPAFPCLRDLPVC